MGERYVIKKKSIIEYNRRKEEAMAMLTQKKQCKDLTVSELKVIFHWKNAKQTKQSHQVSLHFKRGTRTQ